MGVLTNNSGDASLLHEVVGEECLVLRIQVRDLTQQILMGCHQIPHGEIRLVVRLDHVGVFRDLREAHGESLAYCPDLLNWDLDLFRDLVVGYARILQKVLPDLQV